jgi:hypothetical protein
MLGLVVMLPALLFGVCTVALVIQEQGSGVD